MCLFTRLGNFSVTIFSIRFLISCSLSSPSCTTWCEYWYWSPRGSLHYIFLESFFFPLLIGCFMLPYIPNCWYDSWLYLLLIPCKLFFISVSVSFISDHSFLWFPCPFYTVEVVIKLIEHPYNQCLNSLSSRSLVPILFSSFSGVSFCSLTWDMLLCLLILAASLCLFLCIM